MRAVIVGCCLLVLTAGSLHGGPAVDTLAPTAVDPLAPPTYELGEWRMASFQRPYAPRRARWHL
jgi:hypothetical protein